MAVRLFDDPEYGYVLWEEEQSFLCKWLLFYLLRNRYINPIDESLGFGTSLCDSVDGVLPLPTTLVATPYSRMSGIATMYRW